MAGIAVYRCELIARATNKKLDLIFKTNSRVVLIWIIALFILTIAAIPRGFEKGLVIEEICGTEVLYGIPEFKMLLMSFSAYRLFYRGLFLFIVQSGGPVLCVMIMSFLIIRKLRSHIEKCRDPARRSRRANANRMVISVCIIFILLEMPAFVTKFIEAIRENDFLLIRILGIISNISTTLESFSIYWAFILSNKEFRSRLRRSIFPQRSQVGTQVVEIDMDTSVSPRVNSNESNLSLFRIQYRKIPLKL